MTTIWAGPRFVRKWRPIVTLGTILVLALTLAACGSSDDEAEPTEAPAEATATLVPTAAPEPTEEPTTEPAAPTEEPVAEEETNAEEAAEGEGEDASEEEEDVAEESDEAEAVEPRVFFLQPTDNAIIPTTSLVKMGAEGLTVEPSGEIVEGVGHMHILVNAPFVAAGEVIPSDDFHLHFGDGSVETELTLEPGIYTLRLQFANGAHLALEGDEYQDEIVVRVAEDAPEQAVRFAMPSDGATVPPAFDVVMAAAGLVVEPSGPINDDAGHLHILIDTDFIEPGNVIPSDENHLHYGGGQLEAALELEPGEHLLRLQMANGAHIALEGDQYRDEITIVVEEGTPASQVMFVAPEDGASVPADFPIKWAASGLIIEPAGAVMRENAGHLHILIDEEFVEPGNVIPADDTHIHFGGAQTETELSLEPGEHVLRLQMANGAHIAVEGDQYRDEIAVTVAE